jgi:hypothetical protein
MKPAAAKKAITAKMEPNTHQGLVFFFGRGVTTPADAICPHCWPSK